MTRFLEAFEGLEDLKFFSERGHIPTAEYWTAMLRHKSTLKLIVHQQEAVELDSKDFSARVYGHELLQMYNPMDEQSRGPPSRCMEPDFQLRDLVRNIMSSSFKDKVYD